MKINNNGTVTMTTAEYAARKLCEKLGLPFLKSAEYEGAATENKGQMFWTMDEEGTKFMMNMNVYGPAFDGKTFKHNKMLEPKEALNAGCKIFAIVNADMTAAVVCNADTLKLEKRWVKGQYNKFGQWESAHQEFSKWATSYEFDHIDLEVRR